MTLKFEDLRAANKTRCNRWHPNGGVVEWSASEWAVATAGELGEACNAIKKLNRIEGEYANVNDPGRQLETREAAINAIGDELADTIIYMDLLALRLGIDLSAAVARKFNVVSERYGFPERLADDSEAPWPYAMN